MAVVERKTMGERVLHWINISLLILLTICFLYPMWHCVMASFSNPRPLIGYRGFLFTPLGFSTKGYETILKNQNIFTGYANTLFYAGVGSFINVMGTIIGGYCLSKRQMLFRRFLTLMMVFTMYVDFGLIPAFLNVKDLGLYDSRWAIILPTAINTYNMIVMRTAFSSLPASLQESAMLDGANDITILFRIMLPLVKATLAVVILFYVVGHWNEWYSCLVFLQDRNKFPLQLFLREILLANSQTISSMDKNALDTEHYLDELIKYCSIIVSTIPILTAYPFVQKYFVTGIMIGSVKG